MFPLLVIVLGGVYYLKMLRLIIKDRDEFSGGPACGCFNFFCLSACELGLLSGREKSEGEGGGVRSAQGSAKILKGLLCLWMGNKCGNV